MKDDFDSVLIEYFKTELSPSSDTTRSLRIAIDKKEKEIKWQQICITITFIFIFSIVSFMFVNVFLGAIIAKIILGINLICVTMGSLLFTTVAKKEILL